MKLITSVGPNPRMVRMFMAEKVIELPLETIDIIKENASRTAEHVKKNPMGGSPVLELDNGSHLSEVTVICEYLDEKFPGGNLIGTNAEERGEARMWTRRVDLNICEPMLNGFRYAEGIKLFQNRFRCLPEAADGLKAVGQDNLRKMNDWMDGKQWLSGDRFTIADILLFCWLDFLKGVGQGIDPAHTNVQAWYDRVAARPSAAATAR